MIIDLNLYKANLPFVKRMIEENPYYTDRALINTIASVTHVHLVVIAYYVAHYKGMNKEIEDMINELKIYYKYDAIEGIADYINNENN